MSATEPAGPPARVAGCTFGPAAGKNRMPFGGFQQLARVARAASSLDEHGETKTIGAG